MSSLGAIGTVAALVAALGFMFLSGYCLGTMWERDRTNRERALLEARMRRRGP